jgi:hypothetical protein
MSTAHSIFFTFRPQINDQQLFEDFVILFLPFVKLHDNSCYSIEEDGTLNKHIHAVITGNYKDLSKFFQKWNKSNGLKDFKGITKKSTNTDSNGFNNQKIPEDKTEFLHVVGYTFKDADKNTRSWSNIPDHTMTEAIEYYHAHRRIKAKETTNKDWTLITGKNCYAHIESYIDKQKIQLPDPLLTIRMAQDRYGFVNIQSKQIRQCVAEIHLAKSKEANIEPNHDEKDAVFTYGQGMSDVILEDVEPILSQLKSEQIKNLELQSKLDAMTKLKNEYEELYIKALKS